MDWEKEIQWQGRHVACMNQGLQLSLERGVPPEAVDRVMELADEVISSANALKAICRRSQEAP